MTRKCKIFETEEYKFVDFSDILADIRDSFLDDMCETYKVEIPMNVNSRLNKSYIRHSTLEQILKTYIYVDTSKTNAIVIPNDLTMTSGGHFITDEEFVANVLRTINSSKRKIPLLIKKVDCKFSELAEFIQVGEGIEFLHQVDADKEKLKNGVMSFADFKKFARNNKLRYILENLIDKIEFKRLFMS
jgi:hypothetical protein